LEGNSVSWPEMGAMIFRRTKLRGWKTGNFRSPLLRFFQLTALGELVVYVEHQMTKHK